MAQKPAIPKGTRDFLPNEVAKRTYLFESIKTVFKRYGFAPIETPSFELSSTLMGKYGEEGDRLIFRILNSGEKMRKADLEALANDNLPKFASSLAEKALRYDLTVPFARFVVQHQHELTFPFKRFQIQPVWRADRPQHGRYQEFFQCDADVVGSDSLLCEVELIQIFDDVLTHLNIPSFTIKLNNRKILSGIAEVCGEADRIIDLTVAIDKLDKIGEEGVLNELSQKGISDSAVEKIKPLFQFAGSNQEKLQLMRSYLANSEVGKKGIEELEYVMNIVDSMGLKRADLEFDLTLARGLNYYTGAIFEVKAKDAQMGSIGGGGRYNDLTSLFGVPNIPGVGISFGVDRIYDVMEEKNLFPASVEQATQVLFFNLGENEALQSYQLMLALRNKKIACEIYPEKSKFDKQFKYAEKKNIPTIVIIGSEELAAKKCTIKNLNSGQQDTITFEALMDYQF